MAAHTIPRYRIAHSIDKHRSGCDDEFGYPGVMGVLHEHPNGVEGVFADQTLNLGRAIVSP